MVGGGAGTVKQRVEVVVHVAGRGNWQRDRIPRDAAEKAHGRSVVAPLAGGWGSPNWTFWARARLILADSELVPKNNASNLKLLPSR